MITPGEMFRDQIAGINLVATQLEARLEKGRMLHSVEKDPAKRQQIELHYGRMLSAYERAWTVIEILNGTLTPTNKKGFCAVCLGMVTQDVADKWFGDYEEASTQRMGVPE